MGTSTEYAKLLTCYVPGTIYGLRTVVVPTEFVGEVVPCDLFYTYVGCTQLGLGHRFFRFDGPYWVLL